MHVLKMKFASTIPMKSHLETVSAAIAFASMLHFIWIGLGTCLLLLFTRYWLISILYLLWIFAVDSKTPEQGGRRWEWLRTLSVFKYAKDYYPVNVDLVPGLHLDQNKNYLLAAFPHGVLATGAYLSYTANIPGSFQKAFPWLTLYSVTIKPSFFLPIFRDFLLAMGFINSTANAINYIFSKSKRGSAVGIFVGGAAEAFLTKPGYYQVVLKNRKGFIKIALRNGTPIIPVFAFGETDLFKHVTIPKGSIIRSCQDWVKETFGFAPILYYGRGFFKYFAVLPFRKPINLIVGRPIEVKRDENPTEDSINALHQEFMVALNDIFEEYKFKYLQNPAEQTLSIF